jgi:hypothetical protein
MSTPSVDQLRDALVTELLDRVQNGEKIVDKESGEVVRVAAPAATLSVAVAYLKAFPPMTVPQTATPAGLLAKHLKSVPAHLKGAMQ